MQDGAYRQTDSQKPATAFAGGTFGNDYVLSLKARKLSGAEGFIINVRDEAVGIRVQWNLGGWGNQQHGVLVNVGGQESILAQVPGSIETNRWYDIQVELKDTKLTCRLDGKLVHEAEVPTGPLPGLFATGAFDEKNRETILKVVNTRSEPAEAQIKLPGNGGSFAVKAAVLTGSSSSDENTFEAPNKVVPIGETVQDKGGFSHFSFRPYSFTVLRIADPSRN